MVRKDGGVDRYRTAPGWIAHIASEHLRAPETAPGSGPRITSPHPRSSQVNSAKPDHEKRFVVDTSRGFDAARAEVRAILDAVATMPKRCR